MNRQKQRKRCKRSERKWRKKIRHKERMIRWREREVIVGGRDIWQIVWWTKGKRNCSHDKRFMCLPNGAGVPTHAIVCPMWEQGLEAYGKSSEWTPLQGRVRAIIWPMKWLREVTRVCNPNMWPQEGLAPLVDVNPQSTHALDRRSSVRWKEETIPRKAQWLKGPRSRMKLFEAMCVAMGMKPQLSPLFWESWGLGYSCHVCCTKGGSHIH